LLKYQSNMRGLNFVGNELDTSPQKLFEGIKMSAVCDLQPDSWGRFSDNRLHTGVTIGVDQSLGSGPPPLSCILKHAKK